ncbi:hypothetical protein OSB04_032043 [Centaurea solstitialis]|uniref:Uncharacterized protein n=1 Tax=Centaurea solstitialis TaxID=347529 RepID=A0AA38SAR2_9ASTR|nr:hypothetical protein OSB04_032043 [Centaurea solstitialis]
MSTSSESSWEEAGEGVVDKHFRVFGSVVMEETRLVIENEIIGTSNPRPGGPNKIEFGKRDTIYLSLTTFLITRIVANVEREFDFFKQAWDARDVKGFSPLQKCTSAIRQLAYGSVADSTDE